MKLEIPFYSQYLDVSDEKWQSKACAVVGIKMILEFNNISISADDLIKEADELGGLTDGGWKHDVLVFLLHNHGVSGYREEFRSSDEAVSNELGEYGAIKIAQTLDEGNPVQVSLNLGNREGNHMVLLTGYEMNEEELKGFYYHDPEEKTEDGGSHKFVSMEDFSKSWRNMAIFSSRI